MNLALEDRVVVITGPAKGMGAAVTLAFAREGCKLALIGRDTDAIKPVAKEVRSHNGNAIVIACDLTDAKQCDAAAAATKEAFGGRIDVLVNVAGGSGPIGKTGVETTPEEFDEIVDLNMGGCFNTMRAVLPDMMARRYGISVEQAVERHAADYALRRVSTDADVAHACLFLASDVSRQITGVDL